MTKNKQSDKYTNFFLFLMCFILLFLLFKWLHFLLNKDYLQPGTYLETFDSLSKMNNTNNTNINNTVPYDMNKVNYIHSSAIDMSAFSKYTCSNWCGPKSQCLLTREQCKSDVDCSGCKYLTALNNFYDNPSTDLGQSYMNESEKDLPKGANEDILCGIKTCNNSFARFDKGN